MDVSVVVTCYNEEKNIGDCLDSLVNQDYSLGKYEIIVSDGNSTDKTQEIVRRYLKQFPNIKLVVEQKKGTAAGRNRGVESAAYDYVAFIDADCVAPSDWLEVLAENYRRMKLEFADIAAVGGRNISPKGASNFNRAVEIALDSYLGSFDSSQGRQYKRPTFLFTLPAVNSFYDKSKIVNIGYFDESLKSEAEDADINHRLLMSGNRLLYIPDSFVWHKLRPTPVSWIKNMFRYGKGRARLLKRFPDMRRIYFFLPLLFIISMALVPFGVFFKIFYLSLLYFPFILIFSFYKCLRKNALRLSLITMCVYIMQHFAYAIGEIYGFINSRVK